MNRQIFFGQYKRIASYFEGTELAASGCRPGSSSKSWRRSAIRFRPKCSPSPIPIRPAAIPRRCATICGEAYETAPRGRLRNPQPAAGQHQDRQPYAVEFLADDPNFERVFLFYKPSLDRLGITVTVRTVDERSREPLRGFDFDIVTNAWGKSLSPGNEQRGYWGSQAADQPGSFNLVGIKNPAVDAMINAMVFAKSRADLVAATKALDRVLLWNHYVVPQWTYGKVRSARWDRFGHPGSDAEIWRCSIPDHLVVGRRQGDQGGKPARDIPHNAYLSRRRI